MTQITGLRPARAKQNIKNKFEIRSTKSEIHQPWAGKISNDRIPKFKTIDQKDQTDQIDQIDQTDQTDQLRAFAFFFLLSSGF